MIKTALEVIFSFLFILLAIAFVLANVAQYIPISKFGMSHILSIGYFYILTSFLALVVLSFFIRKKYLFILGLLLVVGFQYNWRRIIGLNFLSTCTRGDLSLTTYNARSFKGLDEKDHQVDFASWASTENTSDVLVIQEILFSEFKNIASSIPNYYPLFYKNSKSKSTGIGFYSKLPIVAHYHLDMEIHGNQCLIADLDLGQDTIRIVSAHMSSNQVSQYTKDLLTDEATIDHNYLAGLKKIIQNYYRGCKNRDIDFDQLKPFITESKHPVIFAGDMNDTPFSPVYRRFTSILHDHFMSSGLGLGWTYIGNRNGLRIDYIMSTPEVKSCSYKTINLPFSDHVPVQAVFNLKESK